MEYAPLVRIAPTRKGVQSGATWLQEKQTCHTFVLSPSCTKIHPKDGKRPILNCGARIRTTNRGFACVRRRILSNFCAISVTEHEQIADSVHIPDFNFFAILDPIPDFVTAGRLGQTARRQRRRYGHARSPPPSRPCAQMRSKELAHENRLASSGGVGVKQPSPRPLSVGRF